MKRLSSESYQALRDVLAETTWYRKEFESRLRLLLRNAPELLAGLSFQETKRVTADTLVDRLAREESKYQDVILQMMVELSGLKRFPDIERIADPDQRRQLLDNARAAVDHLRSQTENYTEQVDQIDKKRQAWEAQAQESVRRARFKDEVAQLCTQFLKLHSSTEPHSRGYDFEKLLADVFDLYDMQPRLAYSLPLEQIDGAFSFDTDDYILEARWRKDPASRQDADTFGAKVRSKAKNAVGLFVSVNGFSEPFKQRFIESTPFITMDGPDLYAVLDQRIPLDEMLRAKKRHASETGSCFLPLSQILGL